MPGDDGINENEDEKWQEEEETNGADEVEDRPKGVGLCQTDSRRRLRLRIAHTSFFVLGDEQYWAAQSIPIG